MKIVLMGVSGTGKSAVGRALAARLGWPMLEGDDYHPPANVEKMRRGEPLDDDDRAPWFDALVAAMQTRNHVVVTCSALKRRYRDRLREAGDAKDDVRFVYLTLDRDTLAERLASRRGHFFNPALLDSQLATLEPPGVDEALTVTADEPPDALAQNIVTALGLA